MPGSIKTHSNNAYSHHRLTVDSENVIDGGLTPSFDVDLTPFLSKASTYASELSVDTLFANLTDLLKEVAAYGPDLDTGESQTALSGLFDIVREVSEFGGALEDFLDLIENGEFYFEGFYSAKLDFIVSSSLTKLDHALVFFTTVTDLIPKGKSTRNCNVCWLLSSH